MSRRDFVPIPTVLAICLGISSALATIFPDSGSLASDGELPAPARRQETSQLMAFSSSLLGFRGARSCAAAACHGSVSPDTRSGNIRRNEYVFWLERDPHSRSLQTLANERSTRILENLGILNDGSIVDERGYANCVACHNPQPPPHRRTETYYHREGVGCEICHGPSENWISTHHLDRQREQAIYPGMIDTDNLWTRARLCAQCHVGSPGGDVNHDLIAAGHPVLKFELSAYLDMLPKHWDDARPRSSQTELEAQVWAVGQVISAKSALNLLRNRAERANKDRSGVWPEFAEYDCFACHHDLAFPSWRQTEGRTPGRAGWGEWYFHLLSRTSPLDKRGSRNTLADSLRQLKLSMESNITADAQEVNRRTQAALESLQSWLDEIASSDEEIAKLVMPVIQLGGDSNATAAGRLDMIANWDAAAQNYLAIVALDRAYRGRMTEQGKSLGQKDQQIVEQIGQLRQHLAFPPAYESPKNLTGRALPLGTERSHRAQVYSLMTELLRDIGQRSGP